MNRADAIDVIEKSATNRLDRMFNILADAFEAASTAQKDAARQNFERGLPMLLEAKSNAIEMIAKALPE
jgi:hypothetical protein